MRFKILLFLMLCCGSAFAQNVFCPVNANCTTTGNNIHNGTETFNSTVTANGAVNLNSGVTVTGNIAASGTVIGSNIPATISGTGTCTNQFVRILNNAAGPTCATVNMAADITGLMPLANLVPPTGTGFFHMTAGASDSASKLVSLTTDTMANQGSTTTLLHGNAAGQPSFGSVVSADLNITPTTCTNQFVTAVSATGTATCTTDTLASAQHANQGTTVTVLHGNGAGNPSFAVVTPSDAAGNTSGSGNFALVNTPVLTTPNIGAATGTSINLSGSVTAGTTLAMIGVSTLTGGASVGNIWRDCRQDGTIDITGAADSSATINTCITNAKAAGQAKILLPAGNLRIDTSINATNFPGLRIAGSGFQPNVTGGPVSGTKETMLWCNTGSTIWCIETVGSKGLEIDHMAMTLCCGANMGGLSNFARGGILMGRDNAGGGGSANPFCFSEQMHLHDLYITDNGGGNTTFNGSRGQVGIYDVGAENDQWDNIQILSGTALVISQTDIIGSGSTYQTLQTGCPTSMVGAVFHNPVFVGSVVTLPCVEANITNKVTMIGVQAIGCSVPFLFENNAGAAPTSDWFISGEAEQLGSAMMKTTVSLDNMFINMLVQSPPPGFDINMGANSLTLSNNKFLFGHLNGTSGTPFINNTATGTTITGGFLQIGGTTSASNTTLSSTTVLAPGVTDANITFAAASSYEYQGSSGLVTHGQRKFADGTATAPGMTFASHATIGWFLDSNLSMQLAFNAAGPLLNGTQIAGGNAMEFCFSGNVDPNAAACDTSISRDAAGVTAFGTGAVGSVAGSIKATKEQLVEAAAPAGIANQQVVFGDSGDHMLKYNPNNAGEQHVPQIYMLTAQYTNSTTTFSTVGTPNIAFPVNASQKYTAECHLYYQAAATGGLNVQFTGPASPTTVAYGLAQPVALGTTDNSVATAFSTSLGNIVTTPTTNFDAQVTFALVNGANAGTVTLQAKSSAAVQLQIQAGSFCRVQ